MRQQNCSQHQSEVLGNAGTETENPAMGRTNATAFDISSFGGEKAIVVPAYPDLCFPEVVFPTRRVALVAGVEKIRELVVEHHRLLWHSPLQPIFGNDEKHFWKAVELTADFHAEACGGPKLYTQKRGHPHLRVRHFPFTIRERDRELWLDLYVEALRKVAFPLEVAEEYWQWIEALSIRMINRRSTVAPPVRIPFRTIAHQLRQ
ncbi:globin [Candidatus Igneacidithiobacillus taiwanensis]|uniref:globin domain-containing protein n=1 Tax=Candidatus Igneacidithiobacillus taiwanensis TaxID=1945924 RepID=UPI0028A171E4|nr:globin [Candidatus Igneacidithiobacillus taiwanensis]